MFMNEHILLSVALGLELGLGFGLFHVVSAQLKG